MKKSMFAVLAFIVAGAGLWISPYWSMSGLAVAALDGDSYGMGEHVDFPALRENLKGQLTARMTEELSSGESNGFQAIGVALGMMMVDKMIDQFVTPAGLAALVKKNIPQVTERPSRVTVTYRLLAQSDMTWSNTSRVHFGSADDNAARFVFQRSFVSWKLIGIEMPGDALKN